MENIRMFLSGTYDDLKPYRQAVIHHIRNYRLGGFKMENSNMTELTTTEYSLKELERCNLYVGIIGHRYGTVPPNRDDDWSITRCEYELAYRMFKDNQKMRLLIYLADNDVGLPPDLIESEEVRRKQKAFRQLLKRRHTVSQFSSADDLVEKFGADLINLLAESKISNDDAFKLFDDDLEPIRPYFDSSLQTEINKFIDYLALQFSPLFTFHEVDLMTHPLFKDVREFLHQLIPVSLKHDNGRLMRIDVRHVIMRQQTIHQLMGALSSEQLYDLGKQIGDGAARDLLEKALVKHRFVPMSASAFVNLWDYWDRTGGWGKISLLKTEFQNQEGSWLIQIENNFLEEGDTLEKIHHLCQFWRGYIYGFLNRALEDIGEMMMYQLRREDRDIVTIPAYERVKAVEHLEDNEISKDVFRVRFEAGAFSQSRESLTEAQGCIRQGDYRSAMLNCIQALKYAVDVDGKDFDLFMSKITDISKKDLEQIRGIWDNELIHAQKRDKETAEAWFSIINRVVRRRSKRESSYGDAKDT